MTGYAILHREDTRQIVESMPIIRNILRRKSPYLVRMSVVPGIIESMKLTKDQEWTLVVKCLAVALRCIDVDEITANRSRLEAAFDRAWRAWPCSSRFPRIDSKDLSLYMRRSDRRQGAQGYFEEGTTFKPKVKKEMDWGDRAEILELLDDGYSGAWIDLASNLVIQLDTFKKHRAARAHTHGANDGAPTG